MKLMNELIEPVSLTGFAREMIDQYDATPGTLSEIFPSVQVNGLTAEWTIGDRKSDSLAVFRAFDAESKIGSGKGLEKKTASLAAVSIKERFGEYDQLLRRGVNSPETVEAAADRITQRVAKAVMDRIVQVRGEALATGKLAINEDGFVQTADFGRRKEFTATASKLWDARDPGDPIADLETWRDLFEKENGVTPDVLYTSRKVVATLMRSAKIRAYFGAQSSVMVTLDGVNQLLASYGMPVLKVFTARVGGKPVLPEDSIIMAASGAGSTVWGVTNEAADARYGIAYSDQPGLVVGAYQEEDPMVVIAARRWTVPAVDVVERIDGDRVVAGEGSELPTGQDIREAGSLTV